MPEDPALNPYAPPADSGAVFGHSVVAVRDPASVAAALAALERHLADPAAVRADESSAGGRFRRITGFSGLALLLCSVAAVSTRDADVRIPMSLGAVASVALLVFGGCLRQDLSLTPRASATEPVAAMRGVLRAMLMGRGGYLLAALSPTARAQTIPVPSAPPVHTTTAMFPMNSARSIRDWLRGFCISGEKYVRMSVFKNVELVDSDASVALVRFTIRLLSWPQWANVTTLVVFALIRWLGALLWLVLFYGFRKQRELTVTRTLLRGSNGRWYLYTGDFFDGATEP